MSMLLLLMPRAHKACVMPLLLLLLLLACPSRSCQRIVVGLASSG